MGIKFLCPNGHKLHVKAFLSGKKAICPKCGVRVVVPADGQQVDDAQLEADSASSAAEAVESQPPTAAATRSSASAASVSNAGSSTTSPAAGTDPIDDAPSAVWYVRPATGGQFGPAPGEIMRAWIAEGRVGASSLVWRAGWQEWRAASAIFPQLGSLLASPGVSIGPPKSVALGTAGQLPDQQVPLGGGLPVGQVVQSVAAGPAAGPPEPTVIPPLTPGLRKKRRNRDVSLLVSAILLVVSVILVVVLILVWPRQEEPTDTVTPDSETTTNTDNGSAVPHHAVARRIV